MSAVSLRNELRKLLADLDVLQHAIEEKAAKAGCLPYELQTTDGSPALMPIFVARAQALLALAQLEKT